MKAENTILKAAVLAACAGFAGSASAAFTITVEQNTAFLFDSVAVPGLPAPISGDFGTHGTVANRVNGVESIWWPVTTGDRGQVSDLSPINTSSPEAPVATPVTVGDVAQDPVSALKVIAAPSADLTVPDTGDWSNIVNLAYVYHRNNAISGTTPLRGGFTDSTLFTSGGDSVTDNGVIPFNFLETPNSAPDRDPLNCTNGAPNGTVCDDLFIIPLSSFDPVPYSLAGINYEFRFNVMPGPTATTNLAECRVVPTPENCFETFQIGGETVELPAFTIWTGEENINWLKTTVEARFVSRVPEPGVLSLMGLGLAGLGLSSLRSRRKAVS